VPPDSRGTESRKGRRYLLIGSVALVAVAALLGYAVSLGSTAALPVNVGPAGGRTPDPAQGLRSDQRLRADQGLGPDQPGDVLGLGRAIHVAQNAKPGGNGSAGAPFGGIQAALDAAQPGDAIRVAPGIYRGQLHTVRAGTQQKPIWLLGDNARIVPPTGGIPPPAAEADEDSDAGKLVTVTHDHIVFNGFDIAGGNKTLWIFKASYVRILHNSIHESRGECVRIKYFSSHNEVAYNHIERCGLGNFTPTAVHKNGEAVYIGTAPEQRAGKNPTSAPDQSNANYIHDNDITPRAECTDVKEGAQDNVVARNTCQRGEDPEGAGFSSRGIGTSFIDNISRDNAGAGIRIGGDGDSDGARSVIRGNRMENNKGYGLKLQTKQPQAAICENLVQGNAGGPSNTKGIDPAVPCAGPPPAP
jgi:hypothetical protein